MVSPTYAIAIGALGATAGFWAVQYKQIFHADDVLDVFACHGIAGIVGAIATGAFAFSTNQGKAVAEQILIQLIAVGTAIAYSAITTFIILKVIDITIGLRISKEEEMQGTDISSHEESAYTP